MGLKNHNFYDVSTLYVESVPDSTAIKFPYTDNTHVDAY